MEAGRIKDEYDGLKNPSQFIFPLTKLSVGHEWLLFRGFRSRFTEKEKDWCNFSSRTLYQIHLDTRFTDLYGGWPSNVRIFQETECGNLKVQPRRGILKCLMESWYHFNKKLIKFFFKFVQWSTKIIAVVKKTKLHAPKKKKPCRKSRKMLWR